MPGNPIPLHIKDLIAEHSSKGGFGLYKGSWSQNYKLSRTLGERWSG